MGGRGKGEGLREKREGGKGGWMEKSTRLYDNELKHHFLSEHTRLSFEQE